jgi:short-subunit dehydrogenase
MSRLAGKRVVITGGSSGIGAGLAQELARRGAAVGLIARRAERLEEVAAQIDAAGGTAAWAVADVRDDAGLAAALDRLEGELGGVDLAIANAGFNRFETPAQFRPGRAMTLYDVNLLGMLRLIDWSLPRFLARGQGHLAAVASLAGFFGLPGAAAYSGSKAAMRRHLQSLRVSLRPHGIAVTTICPGFVETELTAKNPFPMPVLWPLDRATGRIADALERRRGEVVFPWQMRLAMRLLESLPTRLGEAIVARVA